MSQLPKIVAGRLQEAGRIEDHPDANLLAAFTENSLLPSDRAQVLYHLAACADCREIVSLALPQPDVEQAAVRPTASGWFSWPVLRWGALAACLVVVGAAVTIRYREREKNRFTAISERVEIAQVKNEAPAQPGNQIAAAQPKTKGALAPPTSPSRDRLESPRADAKALSQAAPAVPAANMGTAAKVASAEAAPEPKNSTVEVAGQASSVQSMNEAENIPGRAKDALQLGPAGGIGGGTMEKKQLAARVASPAQPLSAGTVPRWTLTSNGALQRSADSGRTWETILVPGQGPFRALSASGLEIWVGGAKGALYHSSDAGQHWMQVQPSVDGQLLTDDIIGVEFTDSLHGTVTSAANETWMTADAGQSWQKK